MNSARRRRVIVSLLLFAIGVCTLWYFRAPLLTGLARAWVVEDELKKTDAIVVLAGGIETRPFAAAEWYAGGVAPTVLVSSTRATRTDKLGITLPGTDVNKRVLLANHVPESAIVMVGTNNASTRDEAVAVRDWVRQTGAKVVLVTTDLFHTRRARWVFQKELKGTGAEVRIRAVPQIQYQVTNWWQDEEGLLAFQNEVVKYAYYRLKY
jgi:uncharacterized SAM-binding protein YcdF (DUF218 family)